MLKKNKSRLTPTDMFGKLYVYLYAAIVILPLYFVVITAFKTPQEISMAPLALPETLQWNNFLEAFKQAELSKAIWNSIYMSTLGVALQMFLVILISYCLHKLRNHKIGTILYLIVLAGLYIPKVGHVTQIQLYRDLGIYNTPFALIFSTGFGGIPFAVFIVAGFLRTIPRELEEAAELDGCNDWQLVTRVLIPVIKPALVTVGIFGFTSAWNNATTALLLIRDEELRTVPMALLEFKATYSTQYDLLFAGMLATGMILVVAYIFCQKYFTQALAGSVKG